MMSKMGVADLVANWLLFVSLMLSSPTLSLVSQVSGQLTTNEQALIASVEVASETIGANLKKITSVPHMAGSPGASQVADDYFEMLVEALRSIPSASVQFDNHTALLSLSDAASLAVDGVEASLEEQPVDTDPTSNTSWRSRIWNGYSPSGTVNQAAAVYVNYGRPEDFRVLESNGINVRGRIVISRYGGCFRGIKVREAEQRGALAVLIYSDPVDVGGPNYPSSTYPTGAYLPESGVQRGSVLNMPLCPGNPKGREVICGVPQRDLIPNIPVMPISAQSAALVMANLSGPSAPDDWQGTIPGVVYAFGPTPDTIDMMVRNRLFEGPVINIVATIPGKLSGRDDHPVVIGNHRDAWVFGAADPNSGSVAMVEVARGLAAAWQNGWRPERTIIMGSWDAEELGMIGSTSFVEANNRLLENAAVYLNLDTAVSGDKFSASSSPVIIDALLKSTSDLDASSGQGDVKFNLDSASINPLGGGSDFVPFLNHLGISSVDFGFTFVGDFPVYHSIYDSYTWMTEFGEPSGVNFKYLIASTKLWGLLAMRISTGLIVPFSVSTLSDHLHDYTIIAKNQSLQRGGIDIRLFEPLEEMLDVYSNVTGEFMKNLGSGSPIELLANSSALALNERAFISVTGLPGRPWYRNVLVASGVDTGYGADTFPALTEAIINDDSTAVVKAINVIIEGIQVSIKLLSLGEVPDPDPDPDPAVDPDEGISEEALATLIIGLPLVLAGTIYLTRRFSFSRQERLPLIQSRAASPVTMEDDDGTTTDV